ncbi:unnamed protein product, partial [Clonostachys rhizophaga]
MKRMQEVADLVTDLYETLAEMRYIEPADIKRGPHNITLPGDTMTGSFNHIEPAIVYLYSILPYVEDKFSGHRNFFRGSFFLDLRRDRHIKQSRDPFQVVPNTDCEFKTKNGPYMPSWVTPLSMIGTRPISILYNARQHRIWILNVEEHRSADLALEGVEPSSARGINNRWAFDQLPSRPAPDVLRDMKQWFREFKVFPDSLRSSGGEGDCAEKEWDGLFLMWLAISEAPYFANEVGEAMKVADQYCPWGIGCQMPEDLPVWEMETVRFIAEDWRAEVERLGLSAPVDETALQVAQLKLAQCEDALEASRAATKDLQPKGPVRAQLEYARRKRDIDYHSVLLQFRKKEFPFIARNWSLLPDVQAQAEEAIERRQADLDSYLESEGRILLGYGG